MHTDTVSVRINVYNKNLKFFNSLSPLKVLLNKISNDDVFITVGTS